MKSTHRTAAPLLPFVCAAVLASAAAASAMPFKLRGGSIPPWSNQRETLVFDAGGSPDLELYTGGNVVERGLQTGGGASITLPDFVWSPYPAGDPVAFGLGRADTADVDGDGDVDIVRSGTLFFNGDDEPSRQRMMTCLNNNGSFTAGWQWMNNSANASSGTAPILKLADFDRDGDPDLVETGSGQSGITVRWNPGNGNFGGSSTVIYAASLVWRDLVTADFDNDGWTDIAAVDRLAVAGNSRLVILTNNGGTFTGAISYTFPANHSCRQLLARDVDRDGRCDLAALTEFPGANTTTGRLSWLRNNGAGFDAQVTLISAATDRVMLAFAMGDLDEDGDEDLAFSDIAPGQSTGTLRISLRSSGTTFGTALTLGTSGDGYNAVNATDSIAIADCDRDGDKDIVSRFSSQMFENTAIHRSADFLKSGWAGTPPGDQSRLAVADLNGDGKEDLIATSPANKKLLWYPGGLSSITAPIEINLGGRTPAAVVAADLDQDGDVDLAYSAGSEVRRLLNFNGGGVTWSDGLVTTATAVKDIAAGSFNRDPFPDLLIADASAGWMRWYVNDGAAGAWAADIVATGLNGVSRVAAGQLVPGGKPETAAVWNDGSQGHYRRFDHNGAVWQSTASFAFPAAVSSACVTIDNFRPASQEQEAVISAGEGKLRLPAGSTVLGEPGSTIRTIRALDWNQDGRQDAVCTYHGGLDIFFCQNAAGDSWARLTLDSSGPYWDAVPLDLDHDGLTDVAALDGSGHLQLFFNTGKHLAVTQVSAHLPGGTVNIIPGNTGDSIRLYVHNRGRSTKEHSADFLDAPAGPDQIRLRFYKAVASGSQYVAGAAMTAAEIQQAVESVNLQDYGHTPASAASGSDIVVNFTAQERNALKVLPGETLIRNIRIKLRPDAVNASYRRFFVAHLAVSFGSPIAKWSSFELPSGYSQPLDTAYDNASASALITISAFTLIEQWRQLHFGAPEGTGLRANDADFDNDGVPNLAEYVTGTNPAQHEAGPNQANGIFLFPVIQGQSPQFRLRLTDEAMSNPKVRITIQQTDSLKTWGTTATRTGGGTWTGLAPYNSIPIDGELTSHLFNVTTIQPHLIPKFFLRLKVEELP